MQYVIKKLMMASATTDLRRQMDVEEEFFSEIDSRDAELSKLGKKIDEQEKEIGNQKQKIDNQKQEIDSQKQELAQKNKKLDEQNQMIRSLAQSMLNAGMTLEEIAKITKMSEERLKGLLK